MTNRHASLVIETEAEEEIGKGRDGQRRRQGQR